MTRALTRAFHYQARACASLGSPFMARLMTLLGDRLDPVHGTVAAKLFAWTGEPGPSSASLPLRLAGGLHALRLAGDRTLADVYPPEVVEDDALWRVASDAMLRESDFLLDWIASPPQTNELGRAAVLRAIGHWLAARQDLPLDLCELGASAGLNLHWDRYALRIGDCSFGPTDAAVELTPDWSGPMPPAIEPRIVARRGVDLNPLSPRADRQRLMAYIWPDQPDRLARMEAALASPSTPVDRADAADWLRRLVPQRSGTTRLICHTVAWQYFPPPTQARATDAIERAGRAATDAAPLAWFGMEADGNGPGAALTIRLWPGDTHVEAGRADFHGRWVDWRLT
ncbi:DUF2332 family protein [Jannaschia sp. S6380]|uniref:DUF2332 domain-containing protein n=1 Tax=Jannaschia sp. S6380 TaxID=2926408 RepID=UPI001FF5F67D|nr:DUF2332 family protein [Jannaschia sp. S6380]MCK0167542.1 DUF2332 family protein [Jannaschia sp. S6380]